MTAFLFGEYPGPDGPGANLQRAVCHAIFIGMGAENTHYSLLVSMHIYCAAAL
jgi:hypothetical protein